jgi:hypothetical protein
MAPTSPDGGSGTVTAIRYEGDVRFEVARNECEVQKGQEGFEKGPDKERKKGIGCEGKIQTQNIRAI